MPYTEKTNTGGDTNKKTVHLLNIDVVRIIAMLMIISLHMISNSGLLTAYPVLSTKYMAVWTVEMIFYICVNCFVLITGYFMCKSNFRMKKLLTLLGEVLFYSFTIYMLFVVTGASDFSLREFISSILPTLTGQYWFISTYVGMYLLIPYLNILIKGMTKYQHRNLILALVAMFSVWPVAFFFGDTFSLQSYVVNQGYSVVWLCVIYIIGAYLRLYYRPDGETTKHFARYLLAATLAPASIFVVTAISQRWNNDEIQFLLYLLRTYSVITVLVPSVLFFILFLNITIKNRIVGWLISFFAPLTLAVYLISEEPHMRELIWSTVDLGSATSSTQLILRAIASVLIIFIMTALIDYLRRLLFKYVAQLYKNLIKPKLTPLYIKQEIEQT